MGNLKELRFGIIGCGAIGRYHAEAISAVESLRLVSVCDVNPKSTQVFAEQYGCASFTDIDSFLDSGIDAVAVCLPPALHSEAVIRSASAGKHIICEKPIATDNIQAEKMVEYCAKQNIKFSVILQHRFDPAVTAVKNSIMRGDLGKLLWASTHCILYRPEEYYTKQKWHSDSGSGALLNQSIHYIDLLMYMMGDAVSVSGLCANRLNYANAPADSTANEDVGLALVKFANGAPAVIEGTTAAYPGLYNELAVYGENGTFIIRNDKLFDYRLKSGNNPEFDRLLDPSAVFTRFRDAAIDVSAHTAQYRKFADSVINGGEIPVSGSEALKSLKLINAIYDSSRLQKIVYL